MTVNLAQMVRFGKLCIIWYQGIGESLSGGSVNYCDFAEAVPVRGRVFMYL